MNTSINPFLGYYHSPKEELLYSIFLPKRYSEMDDLIEAFTIIQQQNTFFPATWDYWDTRARISAGYFVPPHCFSLYFSVNCKGRGYRKYSPSIKFLNVYNI